MKIFRKIIVLKLVAVFILVTSCATDPTKVSGEDAQRLLATQFGTVIDVQPVTIRDRCCYRCCDWWYCWECCR